MAPARTCNDCFFRRHGLCALPRSEPCPTFRAVSRAGMVPPRQPVLVALPGHVEANEPLTVAG